MRKGSLEKTFEIFYDWMNWDISFLTKIYYAQRVVGSRSEKEQINEAFVFKICANWETLIGTLLVDCLNKDTTQFAKYTGFSIPKHLKWDICKAMMVGVGYVDFKSISDLKRFAKRILVPENNPFKEITKGPAEKIDELYTIRNYLAHYSDSAERKMKAVYAKHGFKRLRQPGDYLLSFHQTHRMPRVGVYINAFIKAVEQMESFLGIQ